MKDNISFFIKNPNSKNKEKLSKILREEAGLLKSRKEVLLDWGFDEKEADDLLKELNKIE